MRSSRTITLFADVPASSRGPSSFVVSILLHGAAFGLVWLVLRHTPRINDASLAQRYTVRLLNLERRQPPLRSPSESGVAHPARQEAGLRAPSPGGRPASPSVPRLLAERIPAPQTLVQPDLPPNLLLPQEIPLPLVLMWTPENTPAKQLVPPPPQKVTAANVRPSLAPPNHELNLADLKISASAFVTKAPSLPPSTSSPVTVRGPEPVKQIPETSSKSLEQPTPATVMSLSDLQLEQGTVALPQVNEVSPASSSGSLARGLPAISSGNGNPASQQNGIGAGQDPGGERDKGTAAGGQNVAGIKPGTSPGTSPGPPADSGSDSEPATTRIRLPKDGEFGIVVVGSSLADQYPETLGLWGGRLAYTVYLHVGLAKSWIMQYSLPRAEVAAVSGEVMQPKAPWPFLIVRPHLALGDSDADAVMVHGFVNTAGRFERLAIVFPPEFAQAKFVLGSLQQWQFRPAMRDGAATAVEVLLIIPDETE